MFAACRRGIGSVCNISRSASSVFAPTIRSSILPLLARNDIREAIVARYLSTSIAPGYRAAQGSQPRYNNFSDDDYLEAGSIPNDEPVYTKFQELADNSLVNQKIINEITRTMGHETMTPVQTMTINETLRGRDMIAQARTGTGKTLGFLIPVVQSILNESPELETPSRYEKTKASDIRAIIMSPTRELAEQIAVEAKKITRNTGIKVQVATGGSSKQMMLRQTQREGCHLLVATPGRLNDLLTDPYSKVSAPNLSCLVLDEADRLLDAGFALEIEDIMRSLPDPGVKDRQTLLFSATVPREVMGLVRTTLKNDFQFVQTIQKGEPATHEKIPQKIVEVAGLENLMPALLELCKREIEKNAASPNSSLPFKALIYFSSTANVELATSIFQNLRASSDNLYSRNPLFPTEISQIHGKLTQQQRTRVSSRFRHAKSAIMFSSDVTARGMDFPNVTHVIQIGLPPGRDHYIHRLGRTGRGDKPGEGWIFISNVESRASRRRLRGLPIEVDTSLQAAAVDMTRDAQLPAALATTLTQIVDATKKVDKATKQAAFMATLGVMRGENDNQDMVDALNQWTRFGWGWEEPPPINPKLARTLGLSGLRGVIIGRGPESSGLKRNFDRRDGDHGFGGARGGSRGGGNSFGEDDGFGGGFGSGNSSRAGRERSGHGRDSGFGRRDNGFAQEQRPRGGYRSASRQRY